MLLQGRNDRLSVSVPTDCLVLHGKAITVVREVRLALNTGKLTEPAMISLQEH